jgi:hypothetical protein
MRATFGFLSLCVLGALAGLGCTTENAFDQPVTTDGKVILTATARARLACGEPKKTPVLMSTTGTAHDEVATFGCL